MSEDGMIYILYHTLVASRHADRKVGSLDS